MKKTLVVILTLALFATQFLLPATAAVTVPDPVVWYAFEDADNLGLDSMGYHSLVNTTGNGGSYSQVDGAVGKGIYLDGKVALTLPNDNDVSNLIDKSFTVSYYAMRERDNRSWGCVVGLDDINFCHRVDDSDNDWHHIHWGGEWWAYSSAVEKNAFSAMNLWTYTVSIGNGKTEIQMYMNGNLIKTYTAEQELSYKSNDLSFTLGTISNGGTNGWFYGDKLYEGTIDEVRVWNTVLSAEQIAELAKGQLRAPSESNTTLTKAPIAAYNFNDAENIGKDLSGNDFHLSAHSWGDNGKVEAANGKVNLNNGAVLRYIPINNKDFTDDLTSFSYTIKASIESISDNLFLISSGFDWDTMDGGVALGISPDLKTVMVDSESSANWLVGNVEAIFAKKGADQEHRYTVTYDADTTTLRIWVDNVLIYSHGGVSNMDMTSETMTFAIGCINKLYTNDEGVVQEDWCGYHPGTITVDDAAVFDYALNFNDILALNSAFVDPEPEQPESPETADALSVGMVTAAVVLICSAVVAGKKRK